jgi:VWFA-related protein
MKRIGGTLAMLGTAAALAVCAARGAETLDRTRPGAAGQTAKQPAGATIQVYSRETVVDVTVLDKNGKPVHGLTQADFTVLEDGKPEAIRSFAEFGRDRPAVEQTAEKLPPHTYSNRRPAANGAVNIIVLDAVNTGAANQMRSRVEAVKYLDKMPPGTQVALLQLGNELKFVQGFTTDPEILIATIKDMKNTVMNPGAVSGGCRGNAGYVRNILTMEALRQISAMVMGIKGRKNVLWFTGDVDEPCGAPVPGLDPTLDMLMAAQVTVYTIDAGGLRAPVASAEFGSNTPAAMRSLAVTGYGGYVLDRDIAGPTGGMRFAGSNDIAGAIATAVEYGSNCYTLTYVPAHGNDENYHHITVKVNRPGLELMYRPGYGADDLTRAKAESRIPTTLNATTPEPDKNTMKASMQRFAPPATQLLFDVKFATATGKPGPTDPAVMGFPVAAVKDKPMVRYDVLYELPAGQVAFTDGPDGIYRGFVEFDAVASDVFGKLITSVSRTMPLALDAAEYAEFVQAPFRFFQQIDLPAGENYVRVGVLDKTSNKVGTVEIPLKVAKGLGVVEAGR